MKNIKHINNPQSKFDKKVLSATQFLHPYIKHRLYIAESIGILPKNMYRSNGIIDEGIVKLYERGFDSDADTASIKIELFKITDIYLDELFKKEGFHQNTISTNSILKDELNNLKEKYTIDEDFDFIMFDELNDISYKQDNKHIFLYDDSESTVLNAFNIKDISTSNKKEFLGKIYSWLPIRTTDMIDLYVFGRLSFEEISKVKQIEIDSVKRVFKYINKSFIKNLG